MTRSVKTEPGGKSAKAGQQQPKQQQQQGSGGSSGRSRKQHAPSSKFKGATEALADVVFDIGRDSQTKWTQNHHELEEYALRGATFDNPFEVAQCINGLVPYREKVPPMPDFDNLTQTDEDGTVRVDSSGVPIKMTATQLQVSVRLYEKEVEVVKKQSRSIQKDMTSLYGQVLGQCTASMRRSLEGHDKWSSIDRSKDPIELLKAIQSIMYGQQTHQYLPPTLHQGMRAILNITQGKTNPEDYTHHLRLDAKSEQFNRLIEVLVLITKDNENADLHKTLKITLPKSWKNGPTSKVLGQFVESYNDNETLGKANPLDGDQLHLAMREGGSDSEEHALVPIASDAVTIEAIPDRSNVYIMHGPSKTVEEMAAEQREALERERAERANSVACQHFGCKNRFPRGGPYPECSYHKSPPVFHETAKFWSCCPNKKAYDWEEFQAIPGCCTGVCTEVKEDQKQFLGGCDLREEAGNQAQLKSIDDFNKALEGGSEAAPVLERLRNVLEEIGVENELFDQVVDGMKKEMQGDETPLDAVATELGSKLKYALKSVAAEQLRIK